MQWMAGAVWEAGWRALWQQTLGTRSQGILPGVVELSKDAALVAEAGHQLSRPQNHGVRRVGG